MRSENLALAANRLRSRPLANRSRSLKRWFVIALWFVAWNSPRFESWNWAWLRLEPWTCVCALTPEVPPLTSQVAKSAKVRSGVDEISVEML